MQVDNIRYKSYGMVAVVDKERLVITTEVNANFTKNAESGIQPCLSIFPVPPGLSKKE
jgi:hypothetical protein